MDVSDWRVFLEKNRRKFLERYWNVYIFRFQDEEWLQDSRNGRSLGKVWIGAIRKCEEWFPDRVDSFCSDQQIFVKNMGVVGKALMRGIRTQYSVDDLKMDASNSSWMGNENKNKDRENSKSKKISTILVPIERNWPHFQTLLITLWLPN